MIGYLWGRFLDNLVKLVRINDEPNPATGASYSFSDDPMPVSKYTAEELSAMDDD